MLRVNGVQISHLGDRRQPDHELAPLAETIAQGHYAAAMKSDQVLDQRQAEAEPALGPIGAAVPLDEEIEDARQQIGRNARTVVLDPDDDLAARAPTIFVFTAFSAGAHHDLSARLRVAGRVGEQVRHDLGEPHRIAVDPQALVGDVEGEIVIALLEQIARHLDRLGDDVGDLDPLLAQLHLPARDLRDVEEIVDQPGEVVDLPLDHLLLPGGSRVRPAASSAEARWRSATAGCAARGPAWRGTRPWPGWRPPGLGGASGSLPAIAPGPAAPAPARRSRWRPPSFRRPGPRCRGVAGR